MAEGSWERRDKSRDFAMDTQKTVKVSHTNSSLRTDTMIMDILLVSA